MANEQTPKKPVMTAIRQKDGLDIWFSKESTTTPKGRLAFSSVYEATNTQFDAKDAAPTYRAELRWDNPDLALDQARYAAFEADCMAFIEACKEKGASVTASQISLPFSAKTRKNKDGTEMLNEAGEPIRYWQVKTKCKAEFAPKLKVIEPEGEIVIDRKVTDVKSPDYLYDGCEAAVRGTLMLCCTAGNWYLRVQLRSVYHVGEGERYEGDAGPAPDLGEFGVQSEPVAAAEGGI